MTTNADQIGYWNDVAGPKWVAAQRRLDALMAPLTSALLAAAAMRPGERVLDVGCGCGETSLRAAAAVGARGDVLALDVSRPMLDHARSRPIPGVDPALGAAPVEWRLADAAGVTLAGDRDLVLSRFGVMFFAEPEAAFRTLRRALAPNGRLVMLCWQRREAVAWMHEPAAWLAAELAMIAGVQEGGQDGPGPFSLGDERATVALLGRAGFREAQARPVECALRLGGDVEEAVALLLEHGPAARLVREGPADLGPRAEAVLRERLKAYGSGDGVAMGAACWLYTALG